MGKMGERSEWLPAEASLCDSFQGQDEKGIKGCVDIQLPLQLFSKEKRKLMLG